eukprot:EG_transcript_17177
MNYNGRRPLTQANPPAQGMQGKESLTHNPHRLYRMLAATPPDGDYVQLTPVEVVHGRRRVDLSAADPSPSNIRLITESRKRGVGRAAAPQLPSAADVGNLDLLDDFFQEDGDDNSSPYGRSVFLTQLDDKPKAVPNPKAKALPPVVLNHPEYSSTMMLLHLTRPDVQQHAKEVSTISSVLTMPGPIELKRTIARMFADPARAEEISRAELDRKAKKYEEERRQQMQKQAEQLRLEREALQQEIEKFKV